MCHAQSTYCARARGKAQRVGREQDSACPQGAHIPAEGTMTATGSTEWGSPAYGGGPDRRRGEGSPPGRGQKGIEEAQCERAVWPPGAAGPRQEGQQGPGPAARVCVSAGRCEAAGPSHHLLLRRDCPTVSLVTLPFLPALLPLSSEQPPAGIWAPPRPGRCGAGSAGPSPADEALRPFREHHQLIP